MSAPSQERLLFWVLIVASAAVAVYGLALAFWTGQAGWHTPFVVGLTGVAALVAFGLDMHGVLLDLAYRPWSVITQYIVYVAIGLVLEVGGGYALGLWSYPNLSMPLEIIHVIGFGYPFSFFLAFELYLIMVVVIRVTAPALVGAWVVNVIFQEIPNTLGGQWIYLEPIASPVLGTIPLIPSIAWLLFILLSIFVREQLRLPSSFPYRWYSVRSGNTHN
jgi:hypothetical protein